MRPLLIFVVVVQRKKSCMGYDTIDGIMFSLVVTHTNLELKIWRE